MKPAKVHSIIKIYFISLFFVLNRTTKSSSSYKSLKNFGKMRIS